MDVDVDVNVNGNPGTRGRDFPAVVVDAMLGRLGRWLRLLGVDAEARAPGGEADLIAEARASGRTVLTRHRRRAARLESAGLPVLLLDAAGLGGQIRQVAARWDLPDVSRRFTRCSLCNEPLSLHEPGAAAAWVPAHVAVTCDRFGRCARCGRIYWRSTHADRFDRDLARLLGDAGARSAQYPSGTGTGTGSFTESDPPGERLRRRNG